MDYYYVAVLIQIFLVITFIIFKQYNEKYLKKYLGEKIDNILLYVLMIIIFINSIYIRISWFRISRFYFKHHR